MDQSEGYRVTQTRADVAGMRAIAVDSKPFSAGSTPPGRDLVMGLPRCGGGRGCGQSSVCSTEWLSCSSACKFHSFFQKTSQISLLLLLFCILFICTHIYIYSKNKSCVLFYLLKTPFSSCLGLLSTLYV